MTSTERVRRHRKRLKERGETVVECRVPAAYADTLRLCAAILNADDAGAKRRLRNAVMIVRDAWKREGRDG